MQRQSMVFLAALVSLLAACSTGCQKQSPSRQTPMAAEAAGAMADTFPWPRAGVPVVAIGDLHGDLAAARTALQLAGATDASDQWIGGAMVVVQVGDQIDRADDDRRVIDLFEALVPKAEAVGGKVIPLLGNHEVMVAQGDTRYVTRGAFAAFQEFVPPTLDRDLRRTAPIARGHRAAFRPGGPYARKLSQRNVAVKVGTTLFVHGGLLPKHATEWRTINNQTRRWLAGIGSVPAHFETSPEEQPLWSRHYSFEPGADDCALLEKTLKAFSATRMVVAHTVQPRGVSAACEGKVWRVDAGMSRAYGGPVEVLSLTPTAAKVLRAAPAQAN